MKKVIAVAMALALAFAMCSCTAQSAPATAASGTTASPAVQTTAPAGTESAAATAAPAQEVSFPLSQPVTLTIWQTYSNKLIDTMNQNPLISILEQKTGLKLSFEHPSSTDTATAFQLLIASKNYPDIMRLDVQSNAGSTIKYPGGGEKGITDGAFLKLNDLIAQYAPNYQAARAKGGEYEKDTVCDDGTIWAMFTLNETALPIMQGLVYRKDWADKLGIGAPATIADWETMLTAFKDKEGAAAPLIIEKNGMCLNSEFLSAYGIGKDFYQVNGTVSYGEIQPQFKDYLTLFNKWYSEGLIDPNFATNADVTDIIPPGYQAGGKTGAGVTNWVFAFDGITTLIHASQDPNIDFAPVNNPVLNAGDTTHLRAYWSPVYEPWVITTSCKNPDIAVSFLDWCFSPDVSTMINYGEEGTTYTMVNGKPQFTDMVLNDPKGNDKPTMWGANAWDDGPGWLDFSKAFQGVPANLITSADTWDKTDDAYAMPVTGLSLTSDEATQEAQIMNDINTYVDETVPQFIMGTKPLSDFDSFVSQIKSMGIDQATSIEQAALDRYNKRP